MPAADVLLARSPSREQKTQPCRYCAQEGLLAAAFALHGPYGVIDDSAATQADERANAGDWKPQARLLTPTLWPCFLIERRIRHGDGGGIKQFDRAPSPAPKRGSTALQLHAQVLAQTLGQAQVESLSGLAVRAGIEAAMGLPAGQTGDKALADGLLAGLVRGQYLIDKKTQGDQGRVDALAMASDLISENLRQLVRVEGIAQGVWLCLGKLQAQLLEVVFEVAELGTMHVG